MTVILNKIINVKYIYHISDIHIRRYDKHTEYNIVFDNLYKYLKSVSDENSIIVLTGDILHNKDNLTPDCIIKTFNFLTALTNIMPVIMIAGNHDFVQTNTHIKDSLAAILSERSINNLYYLKNTGAYRFGNIIFGVSSLFDNGFMKASNIDKLDNDILIGLYHGPVGKSETAVGIVLNGDMKPSDFDGYDYVLLGDIHKFQYIRENMAYASSLISQNFSETDIYHGVLIWDLVNKKSEYNIIDNPFRYMTGEINNGILTIDDIIIDIDTYIFPTNARIKLNINNTLKDDCEKIKKVIRKKYPNIIFYDNYINSTVNNNTLININMINYVDILNTYLEKLSEEDKIECTQIFMNKLNEFHIMDDNQLCSWELLDLEFSNLFTYGEYNKIDFTKLPYNDIVGLFAPNSYGKSSLIDILLFSLYDNFSRNIYSKHRTIPSYIVNNNKKKFECKIQFKIGEDIFCVHKKGVLKGKIKSKTGQAITFDIHQFTKNTNGIITNLTRKDRFETQSEIDKLIGSYDDFCLTTLFLQNREKNFFDMSSGDRKLFLYNMFNLDKFEKMCNIFKVEERNAKFKMDNSETYITDIDIDSMIQMIENIKIIIKKTTRKIKLYDLKKKKINKKKKVLYNYLNNDVDLIKNKLIDKSLTEADIDRLKSDLDITNMIISSYPIYYDSDKYNINNITQLYYSINDIIKCPDNISNIINFIKTNNYKLIEENNILLNYDKYKQNIIKKDKIEYQLSIINKQIIENEINEKCNICIKRKNILTELLKNKLNLETELNNIDINIIYQNEYDNIIKIKKEQDIYIKQYNSYIKKLCKNIIDEYNIKYIHSNIIDKLKEHYEYLLINLRFLSNNKNINKLNLIEKKLEYIDNKLNNYNIIVSQNNYELAKLEEKFKQYNNYMEEYKESKKKFTIYSMLKKVSHINGIPSKIISLRLNNIETHVNNLISEFINKKVNVLLDGNNILVHILDTNNNIINILGGMEMFIINIAFKIALGAISVIPKNKILIIDEGVSVLDKSHIEKFDKIAEFLNHNFSHVILISHIESLKDFITQYIHITKDTENLSHVIY